MDGSGGPVVTWLEAWYRFLLPPVDSPGSGKGIRNGVRFTFVYSHTSYGRSVPTGVQVRAVQVTS